MIYTSLIMKKKEMLIVIGIGIFILGLLLGVFLRVEKSSSPELKCVEPFEWNYVSEINGSCYILEKSDDNLYSEAIKSTVNVERAISLCTHMTEIKRRDICLVDVARYRVNDTPCIQVSDINESFSCYIGVVIEGGTKESCKKISDTERREQCEGLARLLLAQKNIYKAENLT